MYNTRLRELRSKLGYSQYKLANMLGLPQTTYSNYESGKANIPDDIKLKLLELFAVNSNWLISGKGEMFLKDDNSEFSTKIEDDYPIPFIDKSIEDKERMTNEEMRINQEISNRLSFVRQKLGYTQIQLAKLLDIAQSTYAKYELGGGIPNKLSKVLSELGVNTNWLFTGKGSPFNDLENTGNLPIQNPDEKDLNLFEQYTERLKLIRSYFNLSQLAFANALGLSQQTYANYETGKALIPDKVKLKFYSLGINLNWLITGEGDIVMSKENKTELEQGNDEENISYGYERLKKIREQSGLSQAKFAEKFGINQSTYGQWEIGKRSIPDSFKLQLSSIGINLHWLITGVGSMFIDNKTSIDFENTKEEKNFIPLLSKDMNITSIEEWNYFNFANCQKLSVFIEFNSNKNDTSTIFAVKINDDSMSISVGDIALAIKSSYKGDGIYVFSINGEIYTRRLQYNPIEKKMLIITENESYKTFETDTNCLIILGKVIGWIRHNN